MTWEVTPGPELPWRSWTCVDCPGAGYSGEIGQIEEFRAAAREHVRTLGHRVTVLTGWEVLLLPLATEVPLRPVRGEITS